MPVNVEGAVGAATAFLNALYGHTVESVRIEEVERADEKGIDVWRITLSFFMAETAPGPFGTAFGPVTRAYKVFAVDVATGEVHSMKIRQINRP